MQPISPEEQARIAAEVAARYGVMCKPEAVQRVATGATAFHTDYVWNGHQLVPVVKPENGQAWRGAINSAWREAARKKRLAEADRKAREASGGAKVATGGDHRAKVRAQAEAKAEAIRKLAEGGATLDDIAAHMGITYHSARKYCQHWKIRAAPKHGGRSGQAVKADARRNEVLAFAMSGDKTIGDVAAFLKITWGAAQKYVHAQGIPVVKRQQSPAGQAKPRAKAEPKPAPVPRPDLTERRAKIAELFKAGYPASQIALDVGVSAKAVGSDIRRMGLRRADYPLLWQTKAHVERQAQKHAKMAERREKVGAMRAEGKSIPQIAEALGCSKSAVHRDIAALGIKIAINPCGFVGSPEYVRQVKAMRARQMTVSEIAAALKLAKSTVCRLIHAGAA